MTPSPRHTIGRLWIDTPKPATMRPPQKRHAAANIAARGPALSTHRPKTAAERPRKTIARLKIQPRLGIVQSPGAGAWTPSASDIGLLKTLNAYAWPMHK